MRKYFLAILLLILIFPVLAKAQRAAQVPAVKKAEYTSRGLRDPFKSPFEIGVEAVSERALEEPVIEYGLSHLEVQGMIWGSRLPQAIINSTTVRIGEVVGGAEILDIRKEGVYVLYEGRQYIIRPKISKK